MDFIIGMIVAFTVLAAIILAVKRFGKPVEGPLPNCCSGSSRKVRIVKQKA